MLNPEEAEDSGIKVAEREEANSQDREGGVYGEGCTEEGDGGHVVHNVVEGTICHVIFEPADFVRMGGERSGCVWPGDRDGCIKGEKRTGHRTRNRLTSRGNYTPVGIEGARGTGR